MIVLLQRVKQASVHVGEELVGECGRGLLAFFCAQQGDAPESAKHLADRMIKLRIFEDDAGKMNLSVKDVGGSLLLVSQFTLAADTKKGNRPSFSGAADAQDGFALYKIFIEQARASGVPVATGRYGAHMIVSLVNDGPATFLLRG